MKNNFEILIEKSNMTDKEAENRIFSALDMLININDLYQNEHEREISKSI